MEEVDALVYVLENPTPKSAKCFLAEMMGIAVDIEPDYPRDVTEFLKIVALLEKHPSWRARLGEMAALSTEWSKIVSLWASLERNASKGVGSRGRSAVDFFLRYQVALPSLIEEEANVE